MNGRSNGRKVPYSDLSSLIIVLIYWLTVVNFLSYVNNTNTLGGCNKTYHWNTFIIPPMRPTSPEFPSSEVWSDLDLFNSFTVD